MKKQILLTIKMFLGYASIVGCLLFVWGMYPQLGLSISSPQHTTITLTILGSLQGSIDPIDTNLVYYSGIYRTQNITQPVTLTANQPSNYFISGDILSQVSGSVNPPSLLYSSQTLTLTPGDGIKTITTQFDGIINSGERIILPGLLFGVDTTPPSLPLLIEGPNRFIDRSDLLLFTWNAGYDGGSGIEEYVIQLSQEAHFPTAIELVTTGTVIQLAANSLDSKKWYWRLGIRDRLGNVIYSDSQFFLYKGGQSATLTDQKPSNQSPVSDQCDGPDLSNNFFDGICTPLITVPQLITLPTEHQAPDTRPLRDQIREWIDNKPLKAYVFPAYDAPHAYTIYEYPEELVYEDIYEREENGGTPVIVYNPRLGIKKSNTVNNQHSVAAVPGSEGFNEYYDYLYVWYQSNNGSCPATHQYCPFEPVCLERQWCQFEALVCYLHD